MIDHLSFYTMHFEAAQTFYDGVFEVLGYRRHANMVAEWDEAFPQRRLAAYGPRENHCFWLVEVKEAATPRHVAFVASS